MNYILKVVRIIIYLIFCEIAIVTYRISAEMENSKSLDVNIYEVRIDPSFIQNKSLIETFLYECQCALFLVDITNTDSFTLIKDLLNEIDVQNYPYLKRILVQNKYDLESTI